MLKPIKDWDDAFANMAYIPGSDTLPDTWTKNAAEYRESGVKIDQNVAYGDHNRERFDLVWPDGPVKGLLVFIHGGYWIRLDKSYWTNFAEGARANGWAVCLPSYTLAPEARLSGITQQIGVAIEAAAQWVKGPICVAGHSAGGHLASRMICDDTPLTPETLDRIQQVTSISGLHDLRPLMQTQMNNELRLDEAEAIRESAILHRPKHPIPLTCWVGGGERPEFIRQSQILAQVWSGLDTKTTCVIDGDHNHFTVLDALRDPNSAFTKTVIGEAS